MNPADRFLRGVGPEPRTFQVGRHPEPRRVTGECTTCGKIFYLDEGRACRGSRSRLAAISAVAAAFSAMGALAIWPVPAAIPGAVAVYATVLFLTQPAWRAS
jgi:hypothetical protein